MTRIILVQILIFLKIYDCHAQHPVWGKTMSSKLSDLCSEVRVSPSGREIFLFGGFGDSLSVGNQILVPESNQNSFIIKYDTSGAVMWSYHLRGSDVRIENAVLDTNGDIIIEGRFFDRIDFGNDVYLNQSVNFTHSAFVARITNSGDPVWIKIFPDSNYGDISLGENGHIYFAHGSFPAGAIAPTDCWIHHLGPDGKVIWETKFISSVYPSVAYPQSLTVSRGQVILGGTFKGDIAISNSVFSASDGLGFFVIRFDTAGHYKWIKNLGVSTYNLATISDMMATDDGGFYLSGGLPNQTWLARYDSVGNTIWQKRTPNGDIFSSSYLSQSSEGNVYFAADFYNSPEFEGYQLRGTNDSQVILNAPNIVVGEISSSGVLRSLNQFEPSLNSVLSVAFGSNNDFYVSGSSHGLTLKMEELALPMKNSDPFSTGDGFLVKLQVAPPVIPKLHLGADTLLCKNESFMLEAKGFVSYQWQDNSTNSNFAVTEPGIYSVFVIDEYGNESKDTIRVSACEIPEVVIPNVITPNDDAYNDFFQITGIDATLNNSLTVYNRWGQVVYHENSYQSNWDAPLLTSGIYFYHFYKAATNKEYNGSLHVVK